MSDGLFTVIGVVLGSGLTYFARRSDVRQTMRLEAADMLANFPMVLWGEAPGGTYLGYRVELERLGTRLRMAGMPESMAMTVERCALQFREALQQVSTDEGPAMVVHEAQDKAWNQIQSEAARWLAAGPIRRRTIHRRFVGGYATKYAPTRE